MRTFTSLLTDALRQGPTDRLERLTPWIIGILGTAMLALMSYAWLAAWLA